MTLIIVLRQLTPVEHLICSPIFTLFLSRCPVLLVLYSAEQWTVFDLQKQQFHAFTLMSPFDR